MKTINRTSFKEVKGYENILNSNVINVIENLHDKFYERIINLRKDRLKVLNYVLSNNESNPVKILKKNHENHENHEWVLDVPKQLLIPGIEISGPSSQTSMFINGLNSNMEGFRADGDLDDNEDASGHSLEDTVQSAINRKGAVEGNLEYFDETKNKKYALEEGKLPFFMHRERGILLDEYDYLIDSKPVCASILDTVLTLMHCGIKQQEKGDYIFFYLPKLENSNEAKFWRDFFDEAVKIIHGLDGDKIKAIMLVESLPFALDMENCLKSLGKYAAGLNAARWDLKASVLEFVMTNKNYIWPDRFDVTVASTPFMVSIFKHLVAVCLKHKGVPIGGMATALPSKDKEVNLLASKSIEADKTWEANNGFLRAWVAHIYHMKTAAMPFKNLHASGWTPSEEMKKPELYPLEDINLRPEGKITQEGTRRNIRTIIEYLEGWFNGRGAKGIDSQEGLEGKRPALMEDLATARISIGQTCQRVLHESISQDTNKVHDIKLVKDIFANELSNILKLRPENSVNYNRAVKLGIDWLESYLNLDFKPLAYYDRGKY
ncbi:MAG: hypothetical protein VXX35_01805 [Chloroflexota bacterium]|nr:hypothetical protein [Chloroflexota bacterium]